jgi:hypothetical protein
VICQLSCAVTERVTERRISRSPDAASDLVTLSNEWPEFINRRSVEWKTISGLAAVMLS